MDDYDYEQVDGKYAEKVGMIGRCFGLRAEFENARDF